MRRLPLSQGVHVLASQLVAELLLALEPQDLGGRPLLLAGYASCLAVRAALELMPAGRFSRDGLGKKNLGPRKRQADAETAV